MFGASKPFRRWLPSAVIGWEQPGALCLMNEQFKQATRLFN